MTRLIMALVVVVVIAGWFASPALSQDKLRFGLSFKAAPHFSLPPLIAEAEGLWKKNKLQAEVVPFRSSSIMTKVVATGNLDMGVIGATSSIRATARGIPMLIVSDFAHIESFVWVRPDSRFKKPEDLKGARMSIGRQGGLKHVYSEFVVKKLGLERDVKFVSVGRWREELAALKMGKIDTVVSSVTTAARVKLRGEVRGLISIASLFPEEWLDDILAARRAFIETHPDQVKRGIRVMLQTVDFIMNNRQRAVKDLIAKLDYAPDVAEAIYDSFRFSRDGRFSGKAVKNLRDFIIDYNILPRDKTPPVEELATTRFVE